MHGVVTELFSGSFSLTFGQLVRADGDKAEADIRRLLFRGARFRRNSTVAVAAPETRPHLLEGVEVKIYGYKAKSFLDSRAAPGLLLEKPCNDLNLGVDSHPAGLTMLHGKRARAIGTSVSCDHPRATMDCYVMEGHLLML